jgi:predicted glycosyltransferase
VRSLSIARGLAQRFRVVLAVTSEAANLEVPADIELVRFPANAHYPCSGQTGENPVALGGHLLALVNRVQPAAILVEYFPFGRQQSAIFVIPFLRAASQCSSRPVILTSLRDIQEQALNEQHRYDKRVVQTANRVMDGVLVHSDSKFISLSDTFALAHELTIPVFYTGYVSSSSAPIRHVQREQVVLVSVGGGRGELPLLTAAMEAQVLGSQHWGLRMRIIAGKFISEENWRALKIAAADVPNLELLRWIPDLAAEMRRAAISVSRCGYNTFVNIVETQTPALVIPFVETEEDEQPYRAAKLEKLGVVRVLPNHSVTPQTLLHQILQTIDWQPTRLSIDCNGVQNTADLVGKLISQRAAPISEMREDVDAKQSWDSEAR